MAIAIISVILILLILLLIAPVKVLIQYENEKLKLNVFLYGIKVFSLKKEEASPPKEPEEKVEKFEKDTKKLSLKFSDTLNLCKTAVRLLRKYVSVKCVELRINVGTGDAASTAISTGILWAAVYNLLGIVGRIMYIDKHTVEISPVYVGQVFDATGKCIIKSRVVYIIIIAISILFKIKSLKGKEE